MNSEHILIPHGQVLDRIDEMAGEVLGNLKDPENTVLVKVLEGGAEFGLLFYQAAYRLGLDLEQTSIRATSYGRDVTSSRDPKVYTTFDQDEFLGKHALVGDDVVETAWTMQKVRQVLQSVGGFASFTFMAMLLKRDTAETDFPVDHYGFEIGPEWIWGMNIDTQGKRRGDRDIMVLR